MKLITDEKISNDTKKLKIRENTLEKNLKNLKKNYQPPKNGNKITLQIIKMEFKVKMHITWRLEFIRNMNGISQIKYGIILY